MLIPRHNYHLFNSSMGELEYTPARGQFIERAKRLQHADLCEDKFVPQTSSPVGALPGYAAGTGVQSHGAQLQFSSSDTNSCGTSCTARDSSNPVLFAQQERGVFQFFFVSHAFSFLRLWL